MIADGRRLLATALVAGTLATPGMAGATRETWETSETQTAPPADTTVTYLTTPDGTTLGLGTLPRLNERGEVLATQADQAYGYNAVVWRPGEVVRVAPGGVPAVGADLSDRGEVAGWQVQPGTPEALPYRWSRPAGWSRLPIEPLRGLARGINDRGQVWGLTYPLPALSPIDVVAWDRGAPVRPPSGTVVRGANGRDLINDRGQVAVQLEVGGGATHAAVWQIGGGVRDLGTLGGTDSWVAAINEAGDVVGSSLTAAGERHAFLWHDGEMTDLGTLGGPNSDAAALNDRGEVIGRSTTAAGEGHAFLWRDGRMSRLEPLGGTCCYPSSDATDINDWGQVVGSSHTPDGRRHAVLWPDGADGPPTDLGALVDDANSGAVDINDRGQVLGSAGNGTDRAVLWTLPASSSPGDASDASDGEGLSAGHPPRTR